MELQVGRILVRKRCLVAPLLVCGADIILGMDIVKN